LIFQVEEIELALRESRCQQTIALQSFVDLLKFFRRVVLQDAAVLLDTPGYENLFIFRHEIFKLPEFLDFKRYNFIIILRVLLN
jgi:hypothetical protein